MTGSSTLVPQGLYGLTHIVGVWLGKVRKKVLPLRTPRSWYDTPGVPMTHESRLRIEAWAAFARDARLLLPTNEPE